MTHGVDMSSNCDLRQRKIRMISCLGSGKSPQPQRCVWGTESALRGRSAAEMNEVMTTLFILWGLGWHVFPRGSLSNEFPRSSDWIMAFCREVLQSKVYHSPTGRLVMSSSNTPTPTHSSQGEGNTMQAPLRIILVEKFKTRVRSPCDDVTIEWCSCSVGLMTVRSFMIRQNVIWSKCNMWF